MKYKVGDKVKVRRDLVNGKSYGTYFFYMDKWEGEVVTISDVNSCKNFYSIEEDKGKWAWTDEMFEDVSENENETQTVDKARTVDVGYYLNTYGHRVIKNVYQGADNGKLFFTTVDGLNQYTLPKDAIEWIIPHPQEIYV